MQNPKDHLRHLSERKKTIQNNPALRHLPNPHDLDLIRQNAIDLAAAQAQTVQKETENMTTTNLQTFQECLPEQLRHALQSPLMVTSPAGNAVVLNEQTYRDLLATAQIVSVPGLEEEILRRRSDPAVIAEEDVIW